MDTKVVIVDSREHGYERQWLYAKTDAAYASTFKNKSQNDGKL